LSHAAELFAEDEFDHLLSRGRSYFAPLRRLVYHLLQDFEERFKRDDGHPEAVSYRVIIPDLAADSEDEDPALFNALKIGCETATFQTASAFGGEIAWALPTELWVSLALSPMFGLKPAIGGSAEYPVAQLRRFIQKPLPPGYVETPGTARPREEPKVDPSLAKKKVFLSISFKGPDENAGNRYALKQAISEYMLEKKLKKVDFETADAKWNMPCVDAEDMPVSGNIREKVLSGMRRAHYILLEIASRSPSVYFELGMAQALGKPWIPVWNRTSFPMMDTGNLPGYIRIAEMIDYELTHNGTISERRQFADKVLRGFAELEDGEPARRDPAHALSERGEDLTVQDRVFYFAHEEGTFWDVPHQEVRRHLEGLGYCEVQFPQAVERQDELVRICYAIKKSALCLIDTSRGDPGFFWRLGYAFASDSQREVVHLLPHKESEITMWLGKPSIQWRADDLVRQVRAFFDRKSR